MPFEAQALKTVPMLTVPEVRWLSRMAQYCWKVWVPSIDGAL
jgi:hypothetical protein